MVLCCWNGGQQEQLIPRDCLLIKAYVAQSCSANFLLLFLVLALTTERIFLLDRHSKEREEKDVVLSAAAMGGGKGIELL